MSVGILAFGSLVDAPGDEIASLVGRRIDGVWTPFGVEYARTSRTRGGAPTLVPLPDGGAPVVATVLVLHEGVALETARDVVYRREAQKIGESITYAASGRHWVDVLHGFAGLDVVVYTALPPNIAPLTAARLAELAVASARTTVAHVRRDGISYLIDQQARGVITPLTASYEDEILRLSGAADLEEAWSRLRAMPEGS